MKRSSSGERWPFGVTARYQNQVGAMVDVHGSIVASWKCGGCPARSPINARMNVEEAGREAQAHALQCTAVPRP